MSNFVGYNYIVGYDSNSGAPVTVDNNGHFTTWTAPNSNGNTIITQPNTVVYPASRTYTVGPDGQYYEIPPEHPILSPEDWRPILTNPKQYMNDANTWHLRWDGDELLVFDKDHWRSIKPVDSFKKRLTAILDEIDEELPPPA